MSAANGESGGGADACVRPSCQNITLKPHKTGSLGAKSQKPAQPDFQAQKNRDHRGPGFFEWVFQSDMKSALKLAFQGFLGDNRGGHFILAEDLSRHAPDVLGGDGVDLGNLLLDGVELAPDEEA